MCSLKQFASPSLFVAIDGDDVGVTLEALVLRGGVADLASFSRCVTARMAALTQRLEDMGAQVIFAGGDSILVEFALPEIDLAWLHELPASPCTFSVGIGHDLMTAYLALRVAKGKGKHQTVRFDSLVACPPSVE